MIISIRNQFKQSMFRYIAFFIVIVLAVSMISIPTLLRQEGGAASWAFKINNEKISYKAFAQEIAEQSELIAQIRAQYGQYADLLMQAMNWPTDPKTLAFDVLVKGTLLNQCAHACGIRINPHYIIEKVNDVQFVREYLSRLIPGFVFDATGALNPEKLKMFLQYKKLSMKDFEQKIEQNLAQIQAMQFVASSCYVPSFDIKQTFISQKLGKSFSYLTFSRDSFLAVEKKKTISDDDMIAFYNKENTQKRRYWVPEKRDGKIVEFNPKNYGIVISDEQISQYYEDNKVKKYVVEPAKLQIQQITEKQLSEFPNISLEMVKEEIQQDSSSIWNKKWELLEPFARGDKKGSFEKEAFLLQNPGDISSVITTKDGKAILQLVKRIPRVYKPIAAVKNEIKDILIEKQFKKSFTKDLKELAKKGDAQALESFIEQKGGKRKMAMGIMKDDTRLAQELFALKNDQYGFFIENEAGVAVLLTNITERHLPDLASIKDIVKNDLYEERAYNALENTIEKVKDAASTRSFDTIAQQFNASLHHIDMVYPDDAQKIQELDKKGLPVQAMMGLDTSEVILVHNDGIKSILVKVDDIEEYDQNKLHDGEIEIKENLIPHRTKTQIESFVASLHRNATIETNESILKADEDYSE